MPKARFIAHDGTAEAAIYHYTGDPQDGFIELRYVQTINTDEDDDDAERQLCGERALVDATLSATDADGLQGRIRWIDYRWESLSETACAAHIECTRNIAIDGVLVR